MKRWIKISLALLFSFLFCFASLGYAQLSDSLSVEGSATITPPTGIFISNVAPATGLTVNSYTSTVLNSRVELGNSSASTVDVKVTVYNNTPYLYKFNNVLYTVGATTYDNENIKFTLTDIKKGDELASKTSKTFTVRFSYTGTNVSNQVLNSILNFEFVPSDEFIDDVAVNDALGFFKETMNTPESYQALMNEMADYSNAGRANATYIGNVVDGTSSDTTFLNQLFSDENGNSKLKLTINGKETNVTIMIKDEDLTTNGGEITLYLTAEDINYRWYQSGDVTVYAAVFAINPSTGQWEQQGDLFEGSAPANAYSGGMFAAKNSFNTDYWESTQAYYGVASGSNIESIIAAYHNQA